MQTFLNEEARHYNRQYRKYPILWILLFLYVGLGVTLLTLAIQCNTSFSCSYSQQSTMLWFGLMILVSLVMFSILPNILRVFLNCFFERSKLSPVKKMSPLSLAEGSPKGLAEGSPKGLPKGTPKPPSSPRPKHALKSFREFTQAA